MKFNFFFVDYGKKKTGAKRKILEDKNQRDIRGFAKPSKKPPSNPFVPSGQSAKKPPSNTKKSPGSSKKPPSSTQTSGALSSQGTSGAFSGGNIHGFGGSVGGLKTKGKEITGHFTSVPLRFVLNMTSIQFIFQVKLDRWS